MHIRYVSVLFSVWAMAGFAQEHEGIHVVGSAEIVAEPDMATLTFGIQGQAGSTQSAMERADTISGDFVERLEDLDIEARDIRSTPVTVYPFMDRDTQRELVRFDRSTTVVVRDLDDFQAVQQAALDAGINTVASVQFSLSNERELQDQARDLALADARSQAEAIADQLGVELGRVLAVTVERPRGVMPQFDAEVLVTAAARQDANYRPGTTTIVQDARVSYQILVPVQ